MSCTKLEPRFCPCIANGWLTGLLRLVQPDNRDTPFRATSAVRKDRVLAEQGYWRDRIGRAGLPTTVMPVGTSLVTTLPAPMMA